MFDNECISIVIDDKQNSDILVRCMEWSIELPYNENIDYLFLEWRFILS